MQLKSMFKSFACLRPSKRENTARVEAGPAAEKKAASLTSSSNSSIIKQQASSTTTTITPSLPKASPTLTITGLGCAWPEHVIDAKDLEDYAREVYDVEKYPAIAKMLAIGYKTGIKTRHIMWDKTTEFMYRKSPAPDVKEIDAFFREKAVPLAADACRKAISEWGGSKDDITHVVGVTATDAGNPGYDQLVAVNLGLKRDVDRTLCQGVGCSGGLVALRCASNIAYGCSARGLPARILVFAAELCAVNVRCDMEYAAKFGVLRVAPTLFSDGAAAFILLNDIAMQSELQGKGIYTVMDYKTWLVPGTQQEMNFLVDPLGFNVHLSKNVAPLAAGSISPSFKELMKTSVNQSMYGASPSHADFDWALHPGGLTVLKGAEQAAQLTPEQLRASYDVYENKGNTSSVAVLATLDRLREMGHGKDDVIACSFGPGMTVEMANLKRVRSSHQ